MFLFFSVIRKCVQTSLVTLGQRIQCYQIAHASPTARSQLKTKYGLEDEPTPLLKSSCDVMYTGICKILCM